MSLININEITSYSTPGSEGSGWGSSAKNIFSKLFPSFSHYLRVMNIVVSAGILAHKNLYTSEEWIKSSLFTIASMEKSGTKFEISGIEHLRNLTTPCVIVGNHMSSLETFALPCLIEPLRRVTFVIKDSLLKYPFFGAVLASRNPIVVERKSARDDLTSVLKEGEARLASGCSVIVFPQSTRNATFNRAEFNSIGIKLARRAGVPVIPLALKTDAWGNGRFLKDFGPISPSKTAHFKFGSPIYIEGNGKNEHLQVCDFISTALQRWGGSIALPNS